MNPTQLHKPDGEPVSLYYCGECEQLCGSEELANRCCQPCECGEKPWSRFQGACKSCVRAEWIRREQEQLDRAEIVEWDGEMMLYSEQMGGSHDGWFRDLEAVADEICEYLADDAEWEPPEFVFASTKRRRLLDLDLAIERMLDDTYEDADVPAKAVAELRKHVDAFNAKHAVVYFTPDYDRKVRVELPTRDRSEAAS